MKIYTTDKIRNVVLLGASGSGKTSLVEAMAYLSEKIKKIGSVEKGDTISDFTKEEQKRKISIQTALIPIEWKDMKINILDTPGFSDFVGEVEEAVAVSDAAIIVVDGKVGIENGTKKAFEICDKYKLPRFVYVSNMDNDNASFRKVVAELTELFGKRIAPINLSIRSNEKFIGYANIISRQGFEYKDNKAVECEIPDYTKEYLENFRKVLMESVAETSEEMMDRYFAGEEFSEHEIRSALKNNVCDNQIILTSMGSNTLCQGVYTLLDDITKYFPSPNQKQLNGINRNTNEIVQVNYDFSKQKSVYVFKTMNDPYIGKYSFAKICSGVLKTDENLYNVDKDSDEKLGKIYIMEGNKAIEVSEVHAGDICAFAKLQTTKTFDTLSEKKTPLIYPKTEISKPYTFKAYRALKKDDIDKLAQSLQKICEEDLTVKSVNDIANHQMLLYGIGNIQLDVVYNKLIEEFKVSIELYEPRIAFRETIRKNSDVEYKHKKQTGGHGQYGHVKIRMSPLGNYEKNYEFTTEVVGGTVPKNYFPAVEKGLDESCLAGPLAGYPVCGINVVLYDGSYHDVDSSEMAFKIATIEAFKDGFMKASPCLLEPIVDVKVVVEEKYTGDIMGDFSKRRGRVLGMNNIGNNKTEIEAEVPMKEMYDYKTTLNSMTQGTGDFSFEFVRYEEAPEEICKAEIERAKIDKESE